MGLVFDSYRRARGAGFEGFIDEISITTVPSVGKALLVRGWGLLSSGRLKRVHCFEVPLDVCFAYIDNFSQRTDLPEGAFAFRLLIDLDDKFSHRVGDYGFLAEADDGRLFPLFQHSPKNVQLELDGRCNLACVMCPQAFGVHSGPLGLDDLLKLKPVIEESECIEINHQGESLLSPLLDNLLKIVPAHKSVAFNCNGTALKGKAARILLDHAPKVRHISISIDAGTEEAFFKIRGTSLKAVMKNAVAFKRARDLLGLEFPRLMITCTVIKDFMKDIPGIVELAAQLDGVFRFWPLVGSGLHGGERWVTPYKGTEDAMFVYDEQVPRVASEWAEMVEKVTSEAARHGVSIVDSFQYSWEALADSDLLKPKSQGVSACPLVFRQRFFNANGNAQMCCVQTQPIFNWREFGAENFDSHPDVILFRRQAAQGIIPRPCSGAACSYIAGDLGDSLLIPMTYIERGYI